MPDYPLALPDFTGEIGDQPGATLAVPSLVDFSQHVRDEIVALASELGVAASRGYSSVRDRIDAQNRFDVTDYGAKCDARVLGGVTTAGASTSITVPGAAFTTADIGKRIVVFSTTNFGAPRAITAIVSATEVTVSAATGITTTGLATQLAVWGTDDSAALNAALAAAGEAADYDSGLGDNLPAGSGHPTVVLPDNAAAGMILASAITLPDGVGFEPGRAMLYNLLADRNAACINVGRFTHIGELTLQAAGGGGIVVGTAAVQAHTFARRIAVWNPGNAVTALTLRGYHHELLMFWVKNGGVGIHFDGSSDDFVGEAYMVGPKIGAKVEAGNNITLEHLRGDTVQGTQAQDACVLSIDNNSRNVHANVQAFVITTQTLDSVVNVGQNSTNKCHNLRINVQAGRTGGNILRLANCAQSHFILDGSNYDTNGWGQPITAGVSYGTGVDTDVKVEMGLPSTGVVPTVGTVTGHCSVLIGETRRYLAQTAVTNVLTGRVAGDVASRWAMSAGGTLSVGDGTNPVDTILYRHPSGDAWATDDDLRFVTPGTGPWLKSSDNVYHRLRVAQNGALVATTEAGAAEAPPAVSPSENALVAWAYDPAAANSTGAGITAGVVFLIKVRLPMPATITNIVSFITTAGAGLSAGQNLAGLYNASGTLLSATADQSTAWATTGAKVAPLVTQQVAAPAGVYYVAWLANGTTTPTFVRGSIHGVVNVNTSSSTGRWLTSGAGQTALPATIAIASAALNGLSYWAAVS